MAIVAMYIVKPPPPKYTKIEANVTNISIFITEVFVRKKKRERAREIVNIHKQAST